MILGRLVSQRRWVEVSGYGIYVALLTGGYYYNLTLVQLGLVDLGTRVVGMSGQEVSAAMSALALTALVAALVAGRTMDRRGWSASLPTKLRLLVPVLAAQSLLTLLAPEVGTQASFWAWIIASSVVIGAGIPLTFGLMSDLIPVRDRGAVAAVVAGLAFAVAAVYPREWDIESFRRVMAVPMLVAVTAVSVVAWGRTAYADRLASWSRTIGPGRFSRPDPVRTRSWGLWLPIALMFSVFFIDSLGFLRIIDAPAYISTSWQSAEMGPRLVIAGTHVVGSLMAGVLYTAFGRRWLFLWILGLFAFTHLLYTFHLRVGPAGVDPPLVLPAVYVLAVSFYTTLNFALWPDLSTAENLGTHTAIGVGIAGWLASFLSTALALSSEEAGLSLLDHLVYVDALALTLAAALPVGWYLRRMLLLTRMEPGG